MDKFDVSGFNVAGKGERYAVADVKRFIDDGVCREGKIFVLHGLRRTGKTVMMEQVLSSYRDKVGCSYYMARNCDKMRDVERILGEEWKKGTKIVCIDEITRIEDFITNSASLPDIYAKAGMSIIVTGTDSLSLSLAHDRELFGRINKKSTTHIPFAEHCNVLGTKSMDDYLKFGGLMCPGKDPNNGIYDLESAQKYLDSSVSMNISSSIANSYKNTSLEAVSYFDLCRMTNKMVEKYSGDFSVRDLQDELKSVIVTKPLHDLPEGIDFASVIKVNEYKQDIASDFSDIINLDKINSAIITVPMVERYEKYLRDMGVMSTVNHFSFDNSGGTWYRNPDEKLVHIVQPAIRYYHLLEASKYIKDSKYFSHMKIGETNSLRERLNNMVLGEMTEQAILFDTSSYFPSDRFSVAKVSFSVESNDSGEYDMLLHDKMRNVYWAFEIKHSSDACLAQEDHLVNPEFRAVSDKEFGKCEGVAVLFNGTSRIGYTGVPHLNIADFMVTLDKFRDMGKTMESMMDGLPFYEFTRDSSMPVEVDLSDLFNKKRGLSRGDRDD